MSEAQRYYSNYIHVTTSPVEIILDFKMITQENPSPHRAEKVVSVVLNPQIAKSLNRTLGDVISKHEELEMTMNAPKKTARKRKKKNAR